MIDNKRPKDVYLSYTEVLKRIFRIQDDLRNAEHLNVKYKTGYQDGVRDVLAEIRISRRHHRWFKKDKNFDIGVHQFLEAIKDLGDDDMMVSQSAVSEYLLRLAKTLHIDGEKDEE